MATDPDGDKIIYKIDSPGPFLKLSGGSLFVFASSSDVGNYTVTITLVDQNDSPKMNSYKFQVTILD